MNTRFRLLSIGLCACLLLTGCAYLPQGDEVNVTFPAQEYNESSPIAATETGIEIRGYLTTGGGAANRDVYRNVSVRLYAEDGTLLCSKPVGDWNVTNGVRNVTFQYPGSPKYVLVYSTDFWNEPMTVEYFVRSQNGSYDPKEVADESDLPVEVSKKSSSEC